MGSSRLSPGLWSWDGKQATRSAPLPETRSHGGVSHQPRRHRQGAGASRPIPTRRSRLARRVTPIGMVALPPAEALWVVTTRPARLPRQLQAHSGCTMLFSRSMRGSSSGTGQARVERVTLPPRPRPTFVSSWSFLPALSVVVTAVYGVSDIELVDVRRRLSPASVLPRSNARLERRLDGSETCCSPYRHSRAAGVAFKRNFRLHALHPRAWTLI
ncbi:hypothetical protein L1887_48639 [Cichorium endivia]|nr:hypothetical protein L1887_48639 [Cichorium endivia]